jgi:hypothetical protein
MICLVPIALRRVLVKRSLTPGRARSTKIGSLKLWALGISSIAEFDSVYSVVCVVQNTVKHSFEPLLSWPKGPPPYWISYKSTWYLRKDLSYRKNKVVIKKTKGAKHVLDPLVWVIFYCKIKQFNKKGHYLCIQIFTIWKEKNASIYIYQIYIYL